MRLLFKGVYRMSKLKKMIITGMLATSFIATNSYAVGYPVVDFSSVLSLLKQTQQEVDQFKQSIKEWTNQLNADIQGKSAQVDAMNNGFANSIVRQNQALSDVFNSHLRQEMQPSSDACSTYSVSDAMNDAMCGLLSGVATASEKRASNLLNQANPTLGALASSQANAKEILDDSRKIAQQEQGDQGRLHAGQGENQAPSPLVVRADVLLGSQGDTYDALTAQSTKTFNDIVIGAKVDTAPPNNNQDDGLDYVDNYLRPNAMRAIAANSLDTIRALRLGQDNNKPSVMQLMQKFVDDHFGTPEGDEWIKKITNTQKDASDFMSDSSVLRSLTQLEAFNNYLSMMRYQSELRQETIQAALLALKNKQVYGN